MRKSILIFFLLQGIWLNAQVVFQRLYSDWGYASIQTNDLGYVICGHGYDTTTTITNTEVVLIKTNTMGDTIWKKSYHGPSDDVDWDMKLTFDGGYIITGVTNSFGAGQGDILLLKTDSTGNLLWTTVMGGSFDDYGTYVQQTLDSGYIICGMTKSYGAGQQDFYLVKTNDVGNVQWAKTYGGIKNDYPYSVYQTSDMGYIIGGTSSSFTSLMSDYDAYLVKVDSSGNLQWSSTYEFGTNDNGNFFHIRPIAGGGYIATGHTSNTSTGEMEMLLAKINSAGNPLWIKKITGATSEFGRLVEPINNGYIVTGSAFSVDYGALLVKTDTNGNLLWARKYDNPVGYTENGLTVHQTADGGYNLLANTAPPAYSVFSTYFIKTDSIGSSGCNDVPLTFTTSSLSVPAVSQPTAVSSGVLSVMPAYNIIPTPLTDSSLCSGLVAVVEMDNDFSFTIYPNPASNKVTIESNTSTGSIFLYDMLGNVIKEISLAGIRTEVDVSNLPGGVYLLKSGFTSQKLIITRSVN
ncbi:MAG TPA: T9SS type A sorting domain-containing protein [Flavobacteriales bacterium]|nr:T9SS type A sorting domain-containing protein [Flavobacteriales bacterium]